MQLTEEYEQLRTSVAEFANDVVAPVIAEYYEAEAFPYPIVKAMGDMGLFGLPFPESVGGMGGDALALFLAIEELARVDSSVAITLEAAVSLGAMPIYRFGSPELREKWLPALCRGEMLGAFGLTEPGGGTDAGAMSTRAVRDGDDWVINGTKSFITNSGTDITGFVIVAAVTGTRTDGSPEITTILVPSDTAGLTVSAGYSKVGWLASDTHELGFLDVRVPVSNTVGEVGRGFAQFLHILDEGRVAIAALATGLAQGCVDESVRYANERTAFGRTIGANQSIAFMIADMDVRAHTSRLAWHDACERMLRGESFKREAAIAKLWSSNAAVSNARDATQVFGGYGFMNEYPVARFWRDAKVLEIGEGTNEVQRTLIARELGID